MKSYQNRINKNPLYDKQNDLHIIPVLNDGSIKKPHELSWHCVCGPTVKMSFEGTLLFIHNEEQ